MITIIRERCQEHFNLGRSVNSSLPRNCFREMAYQIIFEIDPALPFLSFGLRYQAMKWPWAI